tara:strand:+ start:9362 stop:11158 length:1797 start_codon:yes stop_codon:yes gene_type:complete
MKDLITDPTGIKPQVFLNFTCDTNADPYRTGSSNLLFEYKEYSPAPKIYNTQIYQLIILGNPIINDRIDHDGIFKMVQNGIEHVDWSVLNGEFLLVIENKLERNIKIINDRFASIPLFYSASDFLIASVFYSDIWQKLKVQNKLKITSRNFFEFLWLNRILGTKTYDEHSRYLLPASVLTYDAGTASISRYWEPSFEKTTESIEECAVEMGRLLRQSVSRKTKDNGERIGLFLSGGMDSRTVLSSFNHPPVCFTLAVAYNNEVRVAKEVADFVGAKHNFLKIDSDPYSDRLDEMVRIGNGMSSFENALFIGYRGKVSEEADVLFHGHGIDYMFQGMYVPRLPVTLFQRTLFFEKLRTISSDFVTDFLNNVPYRIKNIDLFAFVKRSHRKELEESLRCSVQEVVAAGKKYCNDPYDFWEYMLVHAMSRHYSNPNISSLATCGEQRTVTFDNDIFNFYLSLPVKYRLQGKIARQNLMNMSSGLAKIKTGNTNLPATLSPAQKQAYWLRDWFLRKSLIRKQTRFHAPPEERTWPDRGMMYKLHDRLKYVALEMSRSEALDSLGFLDMDIVRNSVDSWVDKPSKFTGALISNLVTIDRFMKQ